MWFGVYVRVHSQCKDVQFCKHVFACIIGTNVLANTRGAAYFCMCLIVYA